MALGEEVDESLGGRVETWGGGGTKKIGLISLLTRRYCGLLGVLKGCKLMLAIQVIRLIPYFVIASRDRLLL